MSIYSSPFSALITLTVIPALVATTGQPATAQVLILGSEVGADLIFTVSGSANLSGLTSEGVNVGAPPFLLPPVGILTTGPAGGPTGVDNYSGISFSAANYGTASMTFPSSTSGDIFGIFLGGTTQLAVPTGYTSGTAINSSSTFAGQSFTSLGITGGTTITGTWGAGATDQMLTVQFVSAAVPEPSQVFGTLAALGLSGLFWWQKKRRQST